MNFSWGNKRVIWLGLIALNSGLVQPAMSETWLVGPQFSLKQPSQVAKQAKDGDIILIRAMALTKCVVNMGMSTPGNENRGLRTSGVNIYSSLNQPHSDMIRPLGIRMK